MPFYFRDNTQTGFRFYDPTQPTVIPFVISSFPNSVQADAADNFTIDNVTTVPTTLNTTVTMDGVEGTINSVNGSGSYTVNVTWPSGTPKRFTNTNDYQLVVTIDGSAVVAGNTSFVPTFGYDFVNIGTPSFLEGSVLEDFTGDTPTTGGQVVHMDAPSPNPDGLTFDVLDTGEWVIDGDPTQDFTIDMYYIGTDDVVGSTATFTYDTIDQIPDQFTFVDQTGAALNASVQSNIITVAGVTAGQDVLASISGGEYQVDAGAGFGGYTSAQTNVQLGYQIRLRGTASASYGVTTDVVLDLGGITDTFSITTRLADNVPDAFTFVDSTGNEPSTVIESNAITIAGVDSGQNVALSITGGEYSVNSGAYISTSSNVRLGDSIRVRGTSSAAFGDTVNVTLDAAGVSDIFSINTRAAVAPTVQTQPVDQSVTQGQTATFTCAFNNATSVQWYDASDDSVLVGETSATLSIVTQLSDNGNTYYCIATNDNLTAQTNTVSLSITATDISPDQFTFTDVTNQEPNALIESNEITILGVEAGEDVPVSITGGEYSINSGAFTSLIGVVQLNDVVKVRGTASSDLGGVTNVNFNANGINDTFTITTRATGVATNISVTGGLIHVFSPGSAYTDPTVLATDSVAEDVSNTATWSGDTVDTNAALINRVNVTTIAGSIVTASTGECAFTPLGDLPQGSYSYEAKALDDEGNEVIFAIGVRTAE